MVNVVFVTLPEVHLLDLAGPAQVFRTAGDLTGHPVQLHYVADDTTTISHQGLALRTELAWPELDADDLIVVPGRRLAREADIQISGRTLDQILAHHDRGGGVVSICAGAFVLAQAGLLDGRRATTHHALQDALQQRHPAVKVQRDVLYTTDGDVWTSAGIASGIDLSLHLVAHRWGARVAAQVARDMVVYARRNGDEPQLSIFLRARDHLDDGVHRAQDYIDEHFAQTLRLAALARHVRVSERTLTRAFRRAIGLTPLQYQQAVRREQADALIAAGETREAAAHAVGFGDARQLRRLRERA